MNTITPSSDHYELLNVTPGTTEKDLNRAYKRAALIWHPDKNQHREKHAATMFDLICKAYNVLSDPVQRAAFDLAKKAQIAAQERDAKLTGKRKRMKEELQRREHEATKTTTALRATAAAAKKSKTDTDKSSKMVDDLRKHSQQQRVAHDQKRNTRIELAAKEATIAAEAAEAFKTKVVVVKWKRKQVQHTAASLKKLLEERCGAIENIVLGKKGNRAIVEFCSNAHAKKAIDCASALNVRITLQGSSGGGSNGRGTSSSGGGGSKGTNQSAVAPETLATADFESSVLERLRRASKQ